VVFGLRTNAVAFVLLRLVCRPRPSIGGVQQAAAGRRFVIDWQGLASVQAWGRRCCVAAILWVQVRAPGGM